MNEIEWINIAHGLLVALNGICAYLLWTIRSKQNGTK